jgi:flagellar biosynthesis protein FliP
MFKQTRTKDLALMVRLSKGKRPRTRADVPTTVLIPAFIISELKTAFQIGFLIFLPFLVIDLVVSSTLMSMGMMMLPPVFISLPFKILLFVLVDGWELVTSSLVQSFH